MVNTILERYHKTRSSLCFFLSKKKQSITIKRANFKLKIIATRLNNLSAYKNDNLHPLKPRSWII